MMSKKALNRSSEPNPNSEFEEWVLHMIALFYKVLIVAVVGGLGFHQILELITIRHERRLREGR
jgi:nitrate reductase NapE component